VGDPYEVSRIETSSAHLPPSKTLEPHITTTLFRKICKSWDEKDTQLTLSPRRNEELEATIEASRKVTRRVQTGPNEIFADIEAIRRAKIEAGEISEDSHDSDESETPTDEGSCIVVED